MKRELDRLILACARNIEALKTYRQSLDKKDEVYGNYCFAVSGVTIGAATQFREAFEALHPDHSRYPMMPSMSLDPLAEATIFVDALVAGGKDPWKEAYGTA